MLNASTAGDQQNVAIGVAADGQWLAAWSTGIPDGAGWEVATRSFSSDGTASAAEEIDEETGGLNSGDQHSPNVSIVGGLAQVVWAGTSRSSSEGGFSQNYDLVLVDNGPPSAPELAAVPNREGQVGDQVEITVAASDSNPLDDLTFELDFSESPADATIEQIGDQTAIIRWTPGENDYGNDVGFRVRVTDNGQTPLSDIEDFEVEVANRDLSLDLNGTTETGKDSVAEYIVGGGFGTIADENLSILEADDEAILGATAQLVATPDGSAESLSVVTAGTSITADYDFATRTLTLSGSDSSANYQQVLRTRLPTITRPIRPMAIAPLLFALKTSTRVLRRRYRLLRWLPIWWSLPRESPLQVHDSMEPVGMLKVPHKKSCSRMVLYICLLWKPPNLIKR